MLPEFAKIRKPLGSLRQLRKFFAILFPLNTQSFHLRQEQLDCFNLGDFQHYAGNGELVEYLAKHGNIVERQTMFSQIGHRFGCDRVLRLELLLIGCRGKIVQR